MGQQYWALPLRRVATQQDSGPARRETAAQDTEAGRVERLRHPLRRPAHPVVAQRRPDRGLHRARRSHRADGPDRRADSRRPADRGVVQGHSDRRNRPIMRASGGASMRIVHLCCGVVHGCREWAERVRWGSSKRRATSARWGTPERRRSTRQPASIPSRAAARTSGAAKMPSDSSYRKLDGDAAADRGHSLEGRRQEPPSQGGMDDPPKPRAPGSPYVDAVVHGDGLISLQYRSVPGRSDGGDPVARSRPGDAAAGASCGCLHAVRVPGWRRPGSRSARSPWRCGDPVYAGLIVCSHDNSVSETAVFSNVDFKSLGQAKAEDRVVESTLEIISVADGRASDRLSRAKPFRGAELVAGRQLPALQRQRPALHDSRRRRRAEATGYGHRESLQQRSRLLARRQVAGDQRSEPGRLAHLRPSEQRRDAPAGDAPGAVLLARLVAGWQDCSPTVPPGAAITTSTRSRSKAGREAADRRPRAGRRAGLLARRPHTSTSIPSGRA